jgi:hypothetical protein
MKETIYGSVARGHSHKVCVIYKVLPAEFVEGTFPPRIENGSESKMAKFKKQSAGAVPEVRSQVLGAFQPKAESGSPWQQR